MAEITLKYDSQNTLAKKTLKYIISLGVFEKVSGIDQALEEVKKGKINHYQNSDELFKKVLD